MQSNVPVHVPSELIITGWAHIIQFLGSIYHLLPQPRFFLIQGKKSMRANLKSKMLVSTFLYQTPVVIARKLYLIGLEKKLLNYKTKKFLFHTSKTEGLILSY